MSGNSFIAFIKVKSSRVFPQTFIPCNNPTHGCFKFIPGVLFHSNGSLPSAGNISIFLSGIFFFTSFAKYFEIGKINDALLKHFLAKRWFLKNDNRF